MRIMAVATSSLVLMRVITCMYVNRYLYNNDVRYFFPSSCDGQRCPLYPVINKCISMELFC